MSGYRTCAVILVAWASMHLVGCSQVSKRVTAIIEKPKRKTEIKMNLARLHERNGKLGRAKELYEELYQRNPASVEVCHRLAVVSTRLGEYDLAMNYFDKARQLAPHDSDLLCDLGYSLYLQNDFTVADKVLRQALQENPNNRRAMNNLAIVTGLQGKMKESFVLFRQVVSEAEANANLAYLHIQRGEGKDAIQRYSRTLTLDNELTSASQAMLQLAEMEQRLKKSQSLNNKQPPLDSVADNPQQSPESSADEFYLEPATVKLAARQPRTETPPDADSPSISLTAAEESEFQPAYQSESQPEYEQSEIPSDHNSSTSPETPSDHDIWELLTNSSDSKESSSGPSADDGWFTKPSAFKDFSETESGLVVVGYEEDEPHAAADSSELRDGGRVNLAGYNKTSQQTEPQQTTPQSGSGWFGTTRIFNRREATPVRQSKSFP